MKWIIVVIIAIVLIVIKNKYFQKLDAEHEEDLIKDGYASFIRTNWPNLVEQIVSISGLPINKERNDAVFFGNVDEEQVHLGQDMGRLTILYIVERQIIQKWIFEKTASTEDVINEIYHYIKIWDSLVNLLAEQKQITLLEMEFLILLCCFVIMKKAAILTC